MLAVLLFKKHEIWPKTPQYQHLPLPEFSVGWLNGLNGAIIFPSKDNGEASSVPASASEEMETVRTLCGEYKEDICNIIWMRLDCFGGKLLTLDLPYNQGLAREEINHGLLY